MDKVKVNKLVLNMEGLNRKSYAQVKIPVYNKHDLYYYTITDSTLNKTSIELKKQAGIYPFSIEISSIISKLSILKDKHILSESGFQKEIHEVVGGTILDVYGTAIKYAYKPSGKHIENLFIPNEIYAQQQPFYNIFDRNYYSAFAEGTKSPERSMVSVPGISAPITCTALRILIFIITREAGMISSN